MTIVMWILPMVQYLWYIWDIQVPYIMIKITVMFQNLTYVPFFNLHYPLVN
jgi:hypothetical protein